MCKHYQYGILAELYNGFVKIDQKIYKIVLLLNRQGFITKSSCENISSGDMKGYCWIQFEHYYYFQRLLDIIKIRDNNELFDYLSGPKVILMIKPRWDGGTQLDMYFDPADIPFIETQLQDIKDKKRKKSKLIPKSKL